MCCGTQSGTSLWASRRCALPPPPVSVTKWFAPFGCVCVVVDSNSQQSNFPGHDEQPQTDLCDSEYAVSVRKVLFPPVGSLFLMPHSDVTVPPVSNPACSVNLSGRRITIVLSHGFAKRSLRGAQEVSQTEGQGEQ